jgi:hypothetical protein
MTAENASYVLGLIAAPAAADGTKTVIAGLDPAIHLLREDSFAE